MLHTLTNYVPTAECVTEQLLERFGADKLSLIERLSPHFYRARTTEGTLILVTIGFDGELFTREVEMLA